MNSAGDATTFIRRSLRRIARAYGLQNFEVFVVPTLLLLRYGDERSTFVDLSSRIPVDLRLDQVGSLYELIEEAEAARVSPVDGIRRLSEILNAPPRFPAVGRVFTLPLVSAGIVLVLEPSLEELLVSIVLAVAVGALKEAGERWPRLWPLIPAAAALLATMATFLLMDAGVGGRPLRILIPALVTFLPGAALTVAMIELSNGDIIAGGSRLAYGIARLLLLVFGVVVGAQWVGISGEPATDLITLAPYASLAGLLLFTAGVFLHFSAPRGSFPWLLLVVAVAWTGQQLGALFFGGYLGGFIGGAAMIVVAQAIRTRSGAPPLIVTFTPAFWLLVPGAIGLEGLAEIFQYGPESGVDDLISMVVAMISIALGVLFGLMLTGSSSASDP
jgi:uncharacterized membrane protein YjjP (DUF1212 family)